MRPGRLLPAVIVTLAIVLIVAGAASLDRAGGRQARSAAHVTDPRPPASSATPTPSTAWSPVPIRAAVSTSTAARRSSSAPVPGSYLGIVSTGHPHPMSFTVGHAALVLISPAGSRTVASWRVRHDESDALADWSSDGSIALVLRSQRRRADVVRVDVRTGRTTTTGLSGRAGAVILAPDGSGFLVQTSDTSSDALERVSWDGAVSNMSNLYSGPMLRGPDDTVLIGGDGYDDRVHTLDYATGRLLRTVGLHGACHPLRWWDATRVLVACTHTVALVDPATGAKRLLVPERGQGDEGHLDVRHLNTGYYVQVAGACGLTFVDHQSPDGSLHQVHVPGAVGNVVMVGTVGRRLVIQHEVDCGGGRPRPELSLFDPVTRHEQPLVELGADQLLGRVLAIGEVSASPL